MEKEIYDKLDTIFLKNKKTNKHLIPVMYRFFQKSSLDIYAAALFPVFKKNKEIEYEITFEKIDPQKLNSYVSLKKVYDRLIVTPSKVLVDPETKIGFTTVNKFVYPFYNEDFVNKCLAENSSYEMLNQQKFANKQEVKDDMFIDLFQTSLIIDDDILLDISTKIYNDYVEEINDCKNREKYIINEQMMLEDLKHLTKENDFDNIVEKMFNNLISVPYYLSDAIYTCEQKFNQIYDIDVDDIETLYSLSYDEKRYLVIGNQQNIVDFDFKKRKEFCNDNIDIIYPIITCLLKSKGIIDEKTNLVGNKYDKLKEEEEGIDYSKLN